MSMRVALVVFGLLLLTFAGAALHADQVAPENAQPLNLDLGGKISLYHRIVRDSTIYLDIEGPGRLDMIARLVFESSPDTSSAFSLTIGSDAAIKGTFSVNSSRSALHWQNSAALAGDAHKFSLEIPDGDHRLTINLRDSRIPVGAVRYLFYPEKASHKSDSDVYPTTMAGTTTVAFKERLLDFFLSDSAKAVEVNVIGKTSLRAVSRLAYSGVMKGPQKYSLIIFLDGKELRREPLSTEKSVTADFTNHKEWSVGESRTIYVDIPAGKHAVRFLLSETAAPAVALRFTVPQEDVRHTPN